MDLHEVTTDKLEAELRRRKAIEERIGPLRTFAEALGHCAHLAATNSDGVTYAVLDVDDDTRTAIEAAVLSLINAAQAGTPVPEGLTRARLVTEGTPMTISQVIDRLARLPADVELALSAELASSRSNYSDLAIAPAAGSRQGPATAAALHDRLTEALGETFEGYKGGEYTMGHDTLVHVSHYGSTGYWLIGIEDDGSIVVKDDWA